MVDDQIQHHFDSAFFPLCDQAIKIGKIAVARIDRLIIRDVVTEIHLRRREHGRQPDRINPKLLQVVQVVNDALQVARAVVIAIGVTARIDLIDYGVLPPV